MAKFDEEYSTWYYVDLKTKKSQWDAPAGTRFDSKSAGDDVPHQLIVPQNPNQGLMPQAVINHVRQLQIQIHKEITNKGLHKVNIINKAPQGQYYQQGPPQSQHYQQDHHRVSITNRTTTRTILSTGTTIRTILSTRTTTRSILPAATTTTTTKQSRFGGGAGSMALGVGGGLLGGMLLGNAINSWEDHERMEGYQDGYQDGYDNGGDYDGGDFGGGDF